MKELRVGIAGLGRLGRVHAANLAHKIPGAVLTAACVPGADSQAYARQELGLEKVYGDFREMVADPELDAVAIVSPSGEHCWQIEAALDAGKHVFSEKASGRYDGTVPSGGGRRGPAPGIGVYAGLYAAL